MGIQKIINMMNREEEKVIEVTMQIMNEEIPCTYQNCYNWKAGQCGNPKVPLAKRKPPKFCDCDLRLLHHLYPVKKKKNIKNPRYQYDDLV